METKIIKPQGFNPVKRSKPYIVSMHNTSAQATLNFTLFGYDRFFNDPNFGSDAGVVYQNVGGISYSELLAQSQRPMKVNFLDFSSQDFSNIFQVLDIIYADANGRRTEDWLDLGRFFDMYSKLTSLIWNTYRKIENYIPKLIIPYTSIIDGSYYMQGVISPKTTIKFLIYPEKIINPAYAYKKPESEKVAEGDKEGDIIESFNDTPLSPVMKEFYQKLKESRGEQGIN